MRDPNLMDQEEKAEVLADILTEYREPIHYENLYKIAKREAPGVFKSARSVSYYLSKFKEAFDVDKGGVVRMRRVTLTPKGDEFYEGYIKAVREGLVNPYTMDADLNHQLGHLDFVDAHEVGWPGQMDDIEENLKEGYIDVQGADDLGFTWR